MDVQICPDCGVKMVNGLCPECGKPSAEEKSSGTDRDIPIVGSGGWGASVNREPSPRTSGGGFCNG